MSFKEKDLQTTKQHLMHQVHKMQTVQGRPKYTSNMGILGGYGWYLGVPFVLGIITGMGANHLWPVPFSWILPGGMMGLILGLINANFWLWREGKKLQKRKDRC